MRPQSDRERDWVRALARQVAELAASDEYERRRQRWRDVNELRRPDRAPVWLRPAGVWAELLPDNDLVCQEPYLRATEQRLRQNLIKHEIGDDHIFEPCWEVPAKFDLSSDHTWGLPVQVLEERTELGGWRFRPPLQTPEDFDRVTVPQYTYNAAATETALGQADDLVGDILPVQVTCGPHLTFTLGAHLDQLRGMGQMMLDLYVQPERIHRLMARILEGCLADLRAIEESGLLTPNHHQPMFCSDPLGGYTPGQPAGLHHLWADANSQEFDEVSPAMWEEFLLSYQRPLLQQFGRVQYGCCENLTTKIEGVLTIPNLRILVCSAWTSLERVLEACGQKYCLMWRQSAAEVTLTDDLGKVEKQLETGLRQLQGHYYQIVLRELQTLGGHPGRLHEWARLAIAKAEKYA